MAGLPSRDTETLTLRPATWAVNLFDDPSALEENELARCENVTLAQGTADRRDGALKLTQLSAPSAQGKSRTYAATTKYATFTPPLIPAGGFAIQRHFTAVRPSAGHTAWIVSSRPAGQTYHVFKMTLNEAGILTVGFRDTTNTDYEFVTSGAITDGLTCHIVVVVDAVTGTMTVYLNGVALSPEVQPSFPATIQPIQTTGVVWALGVEKETGAAVSANSNFDGKSDGLVIFSLRNLRVASGTATFKEMLRRHSACAWPTPQAPMVLVSYDEDEASGTVMYDRSNGGNNGTYTGTPTVSDPIALLSAPTQMIANAVIPVAGTFNMAASWGSLFYEKIA